MKKEDHLEKAERIERSTKNLDKEKDWELIVEGIYGAAQHYIACICDVKLGEHHETHKGLIKYLKEHNLTELANKYPQIVNLTTEVNGETIDLALGVLKEIKGEINNVK